MSSFHHPALIQHLSQSMGGGPGLMYASEALAAWDAFAPATEAQA